MAHGTSATVFMVADRCCAGVPARRPAPRCCSTSPQLRAQRGEPRQEINPWIQCRGYRDAIDFAVRRAEIDSDRIALWGDSYTGGQGRRGRTIDRRVRAIVAQCPVFGAEPPPVAPTRANFEILADIFSQGDVRGSSETTTGPLPVVSFDQAGTPSLLKPIQAFRWFIDYGGRAGTRWTNSVTRVVPATPVPYHPALCAPFVTAPTLLIVAPEDEMVHANYSVARQAYEVLSGPKQWHDIAGGHFGLLYYPGELFEEASRVQVQFLNKWL